MAEDYLPGTTEFESSGPPSFMSNAMSSGNHRGASSHSSVR